MHTITVSSGSDYKYGDVILDYRKGDDSSDVITVRIDLSNEDVDYCIKGFDCEG